MSAFFQLWGREMASYFRTSIAYVVGAFFLAIAGVSFWILATHLAQGAVEGDLAQHLFGSPGYWLAMLIVTPLLTMRLFAEERRMGTLEMLMTAPVTETSVVLAICRRSTGAPWRRAISARRWWARSSFRRACCVRC